jgi:hypothetical protein
MRARERDHEAVGARLGAPYLAVAAEQLADVRSRLRQLEGTAEKAGLGTPRRVSSGTRPIRRSSERT